MANKKFTDQDKYTIDGMVVRGRTVEEIADAMGVSTKRIESYINKNPIVEEQDEDIDDDGPASESMIKEVFSSLINGGLSKQDASKLLDKALSSVKDDYKFPSAQKLYAVCITHMRTGDYMIKSSGNGRDGMAIMTQAASSKSDDFRNAKPNNTRVTRGNIYNIKTGKIT